MSDHTLRVTVQQSYAAAVEAFDPAAMERMGGDHFDGSPLATVTTDARDRLTATLAALD